MKKPCFLQSMRTYIFLCLCVCYEVHMICSRAWSRVGCFCHCIACFWDELRLHGIGQGAHPLGNTALIDLLTQTYVCLELYNLSTVLRRTTVIVHRIMPLTFFFVYSFILRERERESMSRGEAEREGGRENPKQAPHCQRGALCGASTHKCEILTWAKNQEFGA